MNPPISPSTTLELIDHAHAAAKAAAHHCRNEAAREHFEYALALIAESWITESGQRARSPARVIADVRSTLGLFASLSPGRLHQ